MNKYTKTTFVSIESTDDEMEVILTGKVYEGTNDSDDPDALEDFEVVEADTGLSVLPLLSEDQIESLKNELLSQPDSIEAV